MFDDWMGAVSRRMQSAVGLSPLDLADTTWREFYDAGMAPDEAIAAAADDWIQWDEITDEIAEIFWALDGGR